MKLSSLKHSSKYLVSHYRLLWRVTRSELASRYAGSLFGLGWAVLTPLLMLVIYAAVYLVIFQVRVPGLSSVQYVLLVFSGLVPFLMTSESLSGGVGSIVANRAVLTNTVFPIDLVPVKSVLLGQPTMVVGMVIIIVFSLIFGEQSATMLFLPVVWVLQFLALTGVVWIISLVNLIFRDLQNLIGLVLMALMISSPIAYTPDMVPSALKPLILLNPFAHFVIVYQKIMVLGQAPTWQEWLSIFLIGLIPFYFGGMFFNQVKRAMIDYV